jgi:GGDEF domain-containing protein
MIERRVDHATRKRVSEMSVEEMRQALLVSEKTGLPNKRAFDESSPSPFVAMGDVDGLKRMNDQLGYAAGDVLIQRLADTLVEVGLEAYHDKGDEFIIKGNSFAELNEKLLQAEKIMRTSPFVVHSMSDKITSINGAQFSFGIGTNLKEAEKSLKHQKELRKLER